MHMGIDFAGELGDDVVSTGDGTVVFVGERGGYGKSIVVDHGFGYQSHYAHLNSYTVTLGDDVTRGQIIGAVGTRGAQPAHIFITKFAIRPTAKPRPVHSKSLTLVQA